MYKQNKILVGLLQPVVSALGYELWGVEITGDGSRSIVRVYIDSVSGIGLDDCARVSEQVAGVLDVNDPIQGAYNLEVSSPGLTRPLFTVEQFKSFIGTQVYLKLDVSVNGRKKLTGKIDKVSDESVVITDNCEANAVPVDVIAKAHVVL